MKIMQIMSGAEHGGAEQFFIRLVGALNEEGVEQQAVIRRQQQRKYDLAKNNIPVIELPFRGKLDLYTPYQLGKVAKSFMPDIVMSWMNRASGKSPQGKWLNVGRLGGYYNLKYYKKCHHLVCNTQDICDYVIKQGWPQNNVWHIPNFIDENEQTAVNRKEFNTPDDVPLIIAVGRLHHNKAFDILIKALAEVPNAYLWVAGEGPQAKALSELTEKLNLGDRIRFLGWRDDIAAIHAAADIFVCSSRHEPLGNIILEAWAHKTAVVATRSEGPSQLITDSVNGVLVDIDSPEKMATAIKKITNNSDLGNGLIAEGYKTYFNSFSKDIVVKKYMEFFRHIIQKT